MESSRRKLAAAAAAAAGTSHGGVLPLDVLFDVLVRLPANAICRLRAVCRPWRSLTSDPTFVKAHAAHHPDPLLVASFHDDPNHVHILDHLSGGAIKRVPIPSWHTLLRSRLDLIGVGDGSGSGSCCVIDPATGAVSHLPQSDNDDFGEPWSVWERDPVESVFALGRVDSKGKYQMLRLSCLTGYNNPDEDVQVCSIVTVDLDCGDLWRSTESPEFIVDMSSGVVVGSAVYYFWADTYTQKFCKEDLQSHGLPGCIASFDLWSEYWDTVKGPRLDHDRDDDKFDEYIDMWFWSTLAELKGCLVLAHNNRRYSSCLELWFLTDVDNSLWVKEYSIRAPELPAHEKFLKPILLLDDGRIIIFLPFIKGALLLYDPKTNVFSEVQTPCIHKVSLYTGSLLSLHKVSDL